MSEREETAFAAETLQQDRQHEETAVAAETLQLGKFALFCVLPVKHADGFCVVNAIIRAYAFFGMFQVKHADGSCVVNAIIRAFPVKHVTASPPLKTKNAHTHTRAHVHACTLVCNAAWELINLL